MSERQWYYISAGDPTGPIPESQLQALLQSGGIARETLVWSDNLAEWIPAAQVASFASPVPAGHAITPSEVVLLFADQFAGEGTLMKGGNWTSVTTGAKVGYTDLTTALLSAALLANEQAGSVRLHMQPKKAMFGLKTVNVVVVEYIKDPPAWPEGTFEWMAVEGMRGMQPREATDLFTGMLLMKSTYPHTLAVNIASVGLEKRGFLSTEEKKKLLFILAMTFTVNDRTRWAMDAYPPGPVRHLLDQCRQTRPEIYQGLAEAAAKAISNRKEYPSD